MVRGNSPLTFSAINHLNPAGILLYFPDTTLDLTDMAQMPTTNEIIGFIETDEFIEGKIKSSRILIGLNMDRPYSISPHPNGLKISFPKTLAEPAKNAEIKKSAENRAALAGEPGLPSASLLKAVSATSFEEHIIVNVRADGAIMDYKSFAIENPARIVFDMYKIKSYDAGEKTIAVNSPWVKRIRYNPYPNKLRLVLDTEQQFLAQYFSFPTETGLLIYVGQAPEPLTKMTGTK